jgi:L-threonylcarbamoyladenylate synthase
MDEMKTELMKVNAAQVIDRAIAILKRLGLVAFPTDTVYGLGVLAYAGPAIARMFDVKGRSAEKPIPILVANFTQFEQVSAKPSQRARALAQKYWPGPLTIVVPRSQHLPIELGPGQSIGIRMPDHPFTLELLRKAGPLAVTSANRSGRPNSLTAADVLGELGGHIDLVIDGGPTRGTQPSTVVDCTGEQPQILRKGPIPLADLQATWDGPDY